MHTVIPKSKLRCRDLALTYTNTFLQGEPCQQWVHPANCATSMSFQQTHRSAQQCTQANPFTPSRHTDVPPMLLLVEHTQTWSVRNCLLQTRAAADSAVLWLVRKWGRCRDLLTDEILQWSTPYATPPSLCPSLILFPISVHLLCLQSCLFPGTSCF